MTPRLGTGEVHVWTASLDVDEPGERRLAGLLSREERTRAAGFAARRRREFTIARGVLRCVLGAYAGVDPAVLPIVAAPGEKPAFPRGSRLDWLRFNLAHAGDLALVAVARGREVGVDVERVSPARAESPIADQLFSPSEAALLRSLPPQRRSRAFFACWTRKEAYLKGTGAGMAAALDTVDVLRGSPVPGWSLYDLPAGRDYAAALAVEGGACSIRIFSGSSVTTRYLAGSSLRAAS